MLYLDFRCATGTDFTQSQFHLFCAPSAFKFCFNSFRSFLDVNTVNKIKNSSSGGGRRAAYAMTQHSSSSFFFFLNDRRGTFCTARCLPLISHQRVTPSCLRSSDHVPLCHWKWLTLQRAVHTPTCTHVLALPRRRFIHVFLRDA